MKCYICGGTSTKKANHIHDPSNIRDYCDICAGVFFQHGWVEIPSSVPVTISGDVCLITGTSITSNGNGTITIPDDGRIYEVYGGAGSGIYDTPITITITIPGCECGAHKVKSSVHSSWCDLFEEGL